MKKTLKPVFSILLIAFIILAAVSCNDKSKESTLDNILKAGKIRIGLTPDYMPFEILDKSGAIMGFDIDFAILMAEAMGVSPEFIQVKTGYDTLIPKLKKDEFDIILSGMTATQKRNLEICFSEPYIITGQTLLVNKKHKGKINSYTDLNSAVFKVLYEKGTSGKVAIERLFPKCRYIAVDSADNGVKKLKKGEVDAFIYDQPYCANVMAREGENAFIFLDQPITFEPLAIGMRQDNLALLNWMNNFIRQIQADGKYDELYTKWFLKSNWMKRL